MANQSNGNDIKRLYLSKTDRKLSGVCGGIGEFFGVDSTLVRLAWVLMTVLTGLFPGIFAYIVAAIVVPEEEEISGSDSKSSKKS